MALTNRHDEFFRKYGNFYLHVYLPGEGETVITVNDLYEHIRNRFNQETNDAIVEKLLAHDANVFPLKKDDDETD